MRYLLSVAVLGLTAGVLNAARIHVLANQPTIQAGIDAAVNGDARLHEEHCKRTDCAVDFIITVGCGEMTDGC